MTKETISEGKRTTVRITPTSVADMHEAIAVLVRSGNQDIKSVSAFIRVAIDEKVQRTKEQAAG